MLNNEIIFRVHREPYFSGIELYAFIDNENSRDVAEPMVMKRKELDTFSPAFCQLTNEATQMLIDELWQAGYRPTEGIGSAGSLRATEKHLNDMRKIVAEKLKVQL